MKVSNYIQLIQDGKLDHQLEKLYLGHVDTQRLRYIQALEKYNSLYGDKDVIMLSTPGRSEICGNHTDHQRGKVLAASINLDILAIASKNETVNIVSDDMVLETIDIHSLAKIDKEEGTSVGLVRGILAKMSENHTIGGMDVYMTSEVLVGSGLSSSAAFEVMIGTIISHLYNEGTISEVEIAKVGQYSENVYFNKPCGLMDQVACAVGGLVYIDFKDTTIIPIEPKLDDSLCIIDVHASHASLTDAYAAIPSEMKEVAHYFNKEVLQEVDEQEFYKHLVDIKKTLKNDRTILRAMHYFNEVKRVEKAKAMMEQGNSEEFKKVIQSSGKSSYELLQNIYPSSTNQDVALALALSEQILEDHGVVRVHGGGFAGTIQAFVEDAYVDTFKTEIEKYFGIDSCKVLKIRSLGTTKVDF